MAFNNLDLLSKRLCIKWLLYNALLYFHTPQLSDSPSALSSGPGCCCSSYQHPPKKKPEKEVCAPPNLPNLLYPASSKPLKQSVQGHEWPLYMNKISAFDSCLLCSVSSCPYIALQSFHHGFSTILEFSSGQLLHRPTSLPSLPINMWTSQGCGSLIVFSIWDFSLEIL